MTNHTPGPWSVCPRAEDDREAFSHWVCEENDPGHNIGICLCETRPGSEANARLIAAAPKMLVALQAALPFIVNDDSPGGCDGKQPECKHCAAIAKVRAAIAHATAEREP